MSARALLPLLALAACAPTPALKAEPPRTDLAAACGERDGWADPAPPAHVVGNVWDVGTCGITVLLVTSPQGHILIDGGPVAAAPLVLANIRAAGFDPRAVRWIVSTHQHGDHVGALAALKAATGAQVAAGAVAKDALERGQVGADDPQAAIHAAFPPVTVGRVLVDGEVLTIGPLALTMHLTPVHSPGSASWTWPAQAADGHVVTVTYADSLTAISADEYRFTDHPDHVAQVRAGLAAAEALPCGILLTPHPGASDMFERLAGRAPLEDPAACAAYARDARSALEARLAKEQAR